MFKELRPHALWDAIHEGIKQTILNASAICSLIVTSFQWLQHHFGWLFFLGICASAISFGGIGIGIGRRLKWKGASEVATMARAAAVDHARQPTPSGTAPSERVIRIATLDQIKEYDPKYRKIVAATGTALSVLICIIGAGLISVFFASRTSQKGNFDAPAASQTEVSPTPSPTSPSERNEEVTAGAGSERTRVKKLDAELEKDMQPVLADLTSGTYYCSPGEVPTDRFSHTVLLSQSEAIAHRYEPYGRKFCSTADAPSDQLRRIRPGTSGGEPLIITQLNQRFEELKEDKARIERVAQSPNISYEQKVRATKSVAELDKIITAAETLLKDPALQTNPEKREEIYGSVQRAIAYGNAVVLSSYSPFAGGAPLSAIEKAVKSNIDDYTMKASRGFDGSTSLPNVRTGIQVFSLGVNTAPNISAAYVPTTLEYAKKNFDGYGSVAGLRAKRSKSTIGSAYSSPFRR